MFFLCYHLRPTESHPEHARLGDVFASCWIERDTLDEADEVARALIESEPWQILEREDGEPVTRDEYEDDDPHLEYYEQALTDSAVIVFHVSPRYPVYWVSAVVQQEAVPGSSEAHYFVLGDSIQQEGEDVFDPDFWTGERRQTCLDSARQYIEEAGWNVVSIAEDRPCGRSDVPEDLAFAYDETEEEGACLVFVSEGDAEENE